VTTRPLRPPNFLPDDPGPWSIVSTVLRARGARLDRRYAEPPFGLTLAPPPDRSFTGRDPVGISPGAGPAGAGPIRITGAAREPAWSLAFEGDDRLTGVSPYVLRTWPVPELVPAGEERPGDDPSTAVPPPVPIDALAPDAEGVVRAPGDEDVAGACVMEGRIPVVALFRRSDGALVRWIRGARCLAWSPDGRLLAIGGDWGILLAEGA
jgi:hypothetical protein